MAESIAQQVLTFLKKNPKATNTDLYRKFPKVRENTLRNYKSRFNKSLLQTKSGRNLKSRTSKSTSRSNAGSLRSKVFDFFRENPDASNQRLYEEFSQFSKNKLRHYKASFFKFPENRKNAKDKRTTSKTVKKPATVEATVKLLEKRIDRMEKQVDELYQVFTGQPKKKVPVKLAITDKAGNIEKKIKELEETVSSYIGEKRKKIRNEMSSLDEMQQIVTDKINSFLKGFR